MSTRDRNAPIRVVSPAPRDAWQALCQSDPHALVYHAPSWVDLMCSFGGYEDASRLYTLPEGRHAVLPMVRRRLLGKVLWEGSFPAAWGEGGLLATGGVQLADVATMFADLSSARIPRITLRPNPMTASIWEQAKPPEVIAVPRLAHSLELDGGFDHVWKKRFAGTVRTNVRKAEKSGVTVECDTTGRLIPVYYQLFERSLERWAGQQHEPRFLARWRGHRRDSLPKLQAIAAGLGDTCRLWLASVNGQPAAGIIVMEGASATYALGAMDKELAGPTRANYMLHRLAIEHACESGCRYYHMGESGASQPLAHFKTRFGATPYSNADYHVESLPLTAIDRTCRTAAKRVLGFKDVPDQ